jgi:hypothetical protein
VPQQADLVSYGEIALNVGLAFDLSDSVKGRRLEQLRVASNALTAELLPADQSALVSFSREVSCRVRCRSIGSASRRALQAATPNGETALVDGILAGLIVGESEVGRSLLMVFSDGLDTASATRAAPPSQHGAPLGCRRLSGRDQGRAADFLEDLASFTGGRPIRNGIERRSLEDLQAILDEFRFRYLVTTRRRCIEDGLAHAGRKGESPGRARQGASRISRRRTIDRAALLDLVAAQDLRRSWIAR